MQNTIVLRGKGKAIFLNMQENNAKLYMKYTFSVFLGSILSVFQSKKALNSISPIQKKYKTTIYKCSALRRIWGSHIILLIAIAPDD